MPKKRSRTFLAAFALLSLPLAGRPAAVAQAKSGSVTGDLSESDVLWRQPSDIGSRNLYYGPGGERDQPHGPFTFVEEDLNGTNPKYVVHDRDNVKWTVKLGIEARPETAASRLVWAVGYFTNEDYFLPDLKVEGMPAHLKRGRNLVGPDGTMHAARLKRHLEDEKPIGNWQWRNDPFTGTRQLNGLKVMMALINNWDLKNANNKIYSEKDSKVYMVSDLGASFGTTGLSFPFSNSKGDLKAYAHSKFFGKITPEYVDFRTPALPSPIYIFVPWSFFPRIGLDGLLHHVPRNDARWMGHVLSGLSAAQIRDAFRAAGYTPQQIDAFGKAVQERISELNRL